MFCQANASIFKWKVIHLDFRNTSSSKRLISVYYNESQQGLEDVINATLISKAGIVFISYVFNISDHEMVCFLDGEYSCDLEFLDDEIQKTYVKGFLVVSGEIFHKPWFWFLSKIGLFNIYTVLACVWFLDHSFYYKLKLI